MDTDVVGQGAEGQGGGLGLRLRLGGAGECGGLDANGVRFWSACTFRYRFECGASPRVCM